ncbi:MAG: hypothetical protein ACPLKP_03075, partial [Microgenomates group bacterium]
MTEYQTYLYPRRLSEVDKEFYEAVIPLKLTPKEWEKIKNIDEKLFGKIEPLKKMTPEVHTVYPDFFLTEMGWRIAVLIYLNPAAKEEAVEGWARSNNLPYGNENDKRIAGDKFFEELLKIAADNEEFERYIKEQKIEVTSPPQNREEAVGWFYSLTGLENIPRRLRSQLADLSEDWAKEQFFKEFAESGGDVKKVSNPFRINRLVNPQETLEKIRRYQEVKREIKNKEKKIKGEDPLSEAKRIIYRIYRRWLNILLAENYFLRRVLLSYPDNYNFSAEEKELLQLLGVRGKNLKTKEKEGRVAE